MCQRNLDPLTTSQGPTSLQKTHGKDCTDGNLSDLAAPCHRVHKPMMTIWQSRTLKPAQHQTLWKWTTSNLGYELQNNLTQRRPAAGMAKEPSNSPEKTL